MTAPATRRGTAKPFGSGVSIIIVSGKRHRYLNKALPRDHVTDQPVAPLADAVCRRCGHGYSELMVRAAADVDPLSRASLCVECQLEASSESAHLLQSELGIDLGWHRPDPVSQRMRYGYHERPIPMGDWDGMI